MVTVYSTEVKVIIAALDDEGRLTGDFTEDFVSNEAVYYAKWTTFGTEDAFQKQAEAEARERRKSDMEADGAYFVTCRHCGEQYWFEDGHPAGTACPVYGD